jgi:hypothetical protein
MFFRNRARKRSAPACSIRDLHFIQSSALSNCCDGVIHPSDTHVLRIADLIHRRPAAERDACSRLKLRAASCFPNQSSHMQKCPSMSELRTAQQCLSRMGRPLPSRSCAFITADGRSVQSTPSHLSSIAENARWPASPTATSTAHGRSRSAEKPARQASGFRPLAFRIRRARREPTPLSCDLDQRRPATAERPCNGRGLRGYAPSILVQLGRAQIPISWPMPCLVGACTIFGGHSRRG